jgi:hypothetical protein
MSRHWCRPVLLTAIVLGCVSAQHPQPPTPTSVPGESVENAAMREDAFRRCEKNTGAVVNDSDRRKWQARCDHDADTAVSEHDEQQIEAARAERQRVAVELAQRENAVREKAEQEEAAQRRASELADAHGALMQCQANIDAGRVDDAFNCWETNKPAWSVLGLSTDEISTCLGKASTTMKHITTCVALAERTDDDVVGKASCLDDFEKVIIKCDPLDLQKAHTDREAQLDVAKIKKRVDAKAAPIILRREKAAAAEAERLAKQEAKATAKREACAANNVLSLIAQLRIGKDLDPKVMHECTFAVVAGTVFNTTRDGWTLVRWGQTSIPYVAAFRTRKARADGSLLRTTATATYLGLQQFDMVDGSVSMIPTFKLNE